MMGIKGCRVNARGSLRRALLTDGPRCVALELGQGFGCPRLLTHSSCQQSLDFGKPLPPLRLGQGVRE